MLESLESLTSPCDLLQTRAEPVPVGAGKKGRPRWLDEGLEVLRWDAERSQTSTDLRRESVCWTEEL